VQFTKETITRESKNDETQCQNMRLLELLKVLNIKADDFANTLASFIESKSFANLLKKDQKQKTMNNERSAYPELYLHVLINFIMNSEVPIGGYNAVIDQFISEYNDDYPVDSAAIYC